MLVRDIGEFELIDLLESSIRDRNARQIEEIRRLGIKVTVGIGDDAAAWTHPPATVVSTTDTMVDGVHFRTDVTGWGDLGWKALASNLSDIAAMGCAPTFALVTLGLNDEIPVDGLLEMYQGMLDACESSGGALLGGDVVRSDTFFVTVALQGFAEDSATLLRRDAARPGDSLAVTGCLGSSAGGLNLLLDPGRNNAISDPSTTSLISAHNRPVPRMVEGQALRRHGVRCAMDVSDGLTADVAKLCAASGVSATIRADRIPVHQDLVSAFPDRWLELALGGGEDYELVFTTDQRTLFELAGYLGETVSSIGRIEAGNGEVTVVDAVGNPLEISSRGWDHFGGKTRGP